MRSLVQSHELETKIPLKLDTNSSQRLFVIDFIPIEFFFLETGQPSCSLPAGGVLFFSKNYFDTPRLD